MKKDVDQMLALDNSRKQASLGLRVLAVVVLALVLLPATVSAAPPGSPSRSAPPITATPPRHAALMNGVLYVTVDNVMGSTVLALDPATGDKLWSRFILHGNDGLSTDGTAVYVSSTGGIFALSASDGSTLWQYSASRVKFLAPPAAADSMVFANSYTSGIYALDAATGTKVWSHTLVATAFNAAAVAGGVVYVPNSNGLWAYSDASGTKIWNQGLIDPTTPAVSGGAVYVGSNSHGMYALNASTGATIWSDPLNSQFSTPIVDNGTLYFADGAVHAVSTTDGSHIWTVSPVSPGAREIIADGGVVYTQIGTASCGNLGSVIALDGAAGTHLWQLKGSASGYPADAGNGRVFYIDNTNVYARDTANGQVLWNFAADPSVDSAPVLDGATVYAAGGDFRVHGLNATTGTQTWQYGGNTSFFSYSSSPAASGNSVYALAADGTYYGLDSTASNTALWNHPFGCKPVFGSPITDGHAVYVRTNDAVIALNGATGAKLWSRTLSQYEIDSMSLAGGSLYVAAESNPFANQPYSTLYSLRASDGHIRWSYKTAGGPGPTAVQDGIVYTGSGGHYVYAVRAANGHKVWRHPVKTTEITSIAAMLDTVYVATFHGNTVYALKTSNGQARWAHAIHKHVWTLSPTSTMLYVGADKLYGLNAATGHTNWSFGNGDGVSASTDGTTVYAGMHGPRVGGIDALNGATGALLWQYATAQDPL